jgi:hypothetical protein
MHGPPISVKDDTLYVSTPTQELWFQIGTKDRKSFLTKVEKPSFTPKVIKRKKKYYCNDHNQYHNCRQ